MRSCGKGSRIYCADHANLLNVKIEMNSGDEWKAALEGIIKVAAGRLPGIGEALGAYDEFRRHRREKILSEMLVDVLVTVWGLAANGADVVGIIDEESSTRLALADYPV